jgi:hypothetical protein
MQLIAKSYLLIEDTKELEASMYSNFIFFLVAPRKKIDSPLHIPLYLYFSVL